MPDQTLRWQLRRGMKELDVVLQRYHARDFASAPPAEQEAFRRLLDCEDPAIWRWLMGQDPVPAEFGDVVNGLRRHD